VSHLRAGGNRFYASVQIVTATSTGRAQKINLSARDTNKPPSDKRLPASRLSHHFDKLKRWGWSEAGAQARICGIRQKTAALLDLLALLNRATA
jgi:hypothetical protein